MRQWMAAAMVSISGLLMFSMSTLAASTEFERGFTELESKTTNFGLPQTEATSAIERVIDFILGIVGLIAVGSLIYGGFGLITGMGVTTAGTAGTEKQVVVAKKIIYWSSAGLVIIVLAWVIIKVIVFDFLGT